MQNITIILLKSVFISGLMLAYYWLALRNKRLHSYNRLYLLLTILASVVIPFLHFDWYSVSEATNSPAIKMLQVMNSGIEETAPVYQQTSTINTADVLWGTYGLVCLFLLVITMARIAWVYRLKRKSPVTNQMGYTIVYTNDSKAPFSFFNNLFWKEDIDPNTTTGKLVLQHELTHIQQRHSLDKLLIQSAIICCWVNPFYWLIQKELSLVHEFLADDAAIKDNDTSSFAMMLLESHYKSALPVIINPFYSSIKRRIIMLNQTNKTSYKNLRKAMIAPLLLVPFFLFSFTVHSNPENQISKSKSKMVLILDAAHGGIDEGGKANGLTEKELTLRICRKMAVLAHEYNIDVTETRKEDTWIKLEERVAIANKSKNGVFVSIHVNKSHPEKTDVNGVKVKANKASDGVEIFVSGKSKEFTKSKALASSIIATCGSAGLSTKLSEKGIWVLSDNSHPAVALECGNMDNANDMAILLADKRLEEFCRNILAGIVAYGNAK